MILALERLRQGWKAIIMYFRSLRQHRILFNKTKMKINK